MSKPQQSCFNLTFFNLPISIVILKDIKSFQIKIKFNKVNKNLSQARINLPKGTDNLRKPDIPLRRAIPKQSKFRQAHASCDFEKLIIRN